MAPRIRNTETCGCPECESPACHRKIDEKGGAGSNPIPVYGRTGRKIHEVWCDNGCNCPDCKGYWAKLNESLS